MGWLGLTWHLNNGRAVISMVMAGVVVAHGRGGVFGGSVEKCYLCTMKNIVFDLGGVVFARDKKKYSQEFADFFSYVHAPQMPLFWEEYDRGTSTLDQATDALCDLHGCTREKCTTFLTEAIARQEPIKPTEQLITDLKAAGYKLYVLSNMSHEFIAHLRGFDVYRNFDGEVVSCEEGAVKPEPRIYEILLDRYALDPSETLFIDDRRTNIEAAARHGIRGCVFDFHDPEATCDYLRGMLL